MECKKRAQEFPLWLRETTGPNWRWDRRHQRFLYRHLHRVTTGRSRRLMIFMPPRHGKSETVTVRYTAWRIERERTLKVILGCYNQRLANRFSRNIRRIAEERIPLAKDRRAADEWETPEGGGVRAAGVGAGVTGFGASLIVIDDPVKSRAQAESVIYRDNVWDWFNDDLYTRLEPNGAIILIQTRWHEDDLAGRLLKRMAEGGEKWDVVRLPAIAEDNDPLRRKPGTALWPGRFSLADLERIRAQQGSHSFGSLYQQNPVPREGGIFKRGWFTRFVDRPPKHLRWVRGYDLAVSTKTSADHTASFLCGLDERTGELYIADGFRGQIEYPAQRRFVLERLKAEPHVLHSIESSLHGKALLQDLRTDRRTAGKSLCGVDVDADKLTRALGWAALAEEGKVVLVRGGWNEEFIDEACSFPHGRHDDQVDAVSLAWRMIRKGRKRGIVAFD